MDKWSDGQNANVVKITPQCFNRNDKKKLQRRTIKKKRSEKNITFYLILPKLKHELKIHP